MTTFKPLYDRVLIEQIAEDEKKMSIVLPESSKDKPSIGIVKAVGHGRIAENGNLIPLLVKVGDTVVFGKYSGTNVQLDNETYMFMKESDIISIIEKEIKIEETNKEVE